MNDSDLNRLENSAAALAKAAADFRALRDRARRHDLPSKEETASALAALARAAVQTVQRAEAMLQDAIGLQ